MKREELKKELVQAGVPDYMYNLTGIGRTDERLCLEKNENGWMVYYMERGIKTTNKIRNFFFFIFHFLLLYFFIINQNNP